MFCRRLCSQSWRLEKQNFLRTKLQGSKKDNRTAFPSLYIDMYLLLDLRYSRKFICGLCISRQLLGKDLNGVGLHELQHLEEELIEGLQSVREKKVWVG